MALIEPSTQENYHNAQQPEVQANDDDREMYFQGNTVTGPASLNTTRALPDFGPLPEQLSSSDSKNYERSAPSSLPENWAKDELEKIKAVADSQSGEPAPVAHPYIADYAKAMGRFIAAQTTFMHDGGISSYVHEQEAFFEVQFGLVGGLDQVKHSKLLGHFIALQGQLLHELGVI